MYLRYLQISFIAENIISRNARSKEHKTNGVKYWIKILSLSFTGYSFPDLHFTSPVCSCIYFHQYFIMNSVGPITQNVNKKSLETLLRAFIFLFNPNKKQINWYSLQYLISYACKRIIGIKGISVDSCDYPVSQSREDNCSIQTWRVRKGCQHTKTLQQIESWILIKYFLFLLSWAWSVLGWPRPHPQCSRLHLKAW